MKTTFLVARNAERIPTVAVAALVVLFFAGCSQAVSPTSPSATGSGNSSGGAIQGAKAVPFKGSLEGTVTVTPLQPPLASVHISATGNATQLGQFTLEVPHIVNFATAFGQGTFTFTAANGDTLTADFTGQAQTSTPIHSSVEDATITGGTGRFAGASGRFIVHRSFDPVGGTTTGLFEGTISSPGSGTK
jgi:hypothetical protein